MIIYLHGFDATVPSNYEKMNQLRRIDTEVYPVSYSTVYPKKDRIAIMKKVHELLKKTIDPCPLIIGVGLGAFWSERIGSTCHIKQVMLNPNLYPEDTMVGKIEFPDEYSDIKGQYKSNFRSINTNQCLCILSSKYQNDNDLSVEDELSKYYTILHDQSQTYTFENIEGYLTTIMEFKYSSILSV